MTLAKRIAWVQLVVALFAVSSAGAVLAVMTVFVKYGYILDPWLILTPSQDVPVRALV